VRALSFLEVITVNTNTAPLLWSIEETARQMGGVSTRTVRRMIDRRELPTVRVGRRVCIPSADVQRYVTQHTATPHNDNAEPAVHQPKESNA
jgi:excisionase family DNA binding protein